MRWIATALVAALCPLGCQPSSRCSDDKLRAAQQQLDQLDARLPLRTITTGVARDEHLAARVAAQGLAADAEVTAEVIVRLVDLAKEAGISQVGALAVEHSASIDPIMLISSSTDDDRASGGMPVRLCVEPRRSWIDDPAASGSPRSHELVEGARAGEAPLAELRHREVSVVLAAPGLSLQSLVQHLGPIEHGADELRLLPESFDCARWWKYERAAEDSLAEVRSTLRSRDTAGKVACDAWTQHLATYPLAAELNDSWVARAACEHDEP